MQQKANDYLNSCVNHDILNARDDKRLIRLLKRIVALPSGRHQITVTIRDGVEDWTVTPLGKVEQ